MSDFDPNIERWLPVVGFEGLYEVSDHGRVRSVLRTLAYTQTLPSGRQKTVQRTHQPTLLRPGIVKSGHHLVVLGRNNSRLVHALVLTAFVGPRPDGHDSCHDDGDPGNNRLDNLRWDSRSANIQDAIRHGTWGHAIPLGASSPRALLTEEQVMQAVVDFRSLPARTVAERFGVSTSTIGKIRTGKTWAHLTKIGAGT